MEKNNIEGQLNLFQEKQSPPAKVKVKKKKECDPAQSFDERMKRFLHYMEHRGMDERWIEMAYGEIRVVIEALADYHDMVSMRIEEMEGGYAKAVWIDRLERIKQIQGKLEESTGYSRDRQLEVCKKHRPSKGSDIGEDALVLFANKK